jgi:transcription antitermination factor NusG
VEDEVIRSLQDCFLSEEPLPVDNQVQNGDEVLLVEGAFAGMRAHVLRAMPARQRVQVLLDILGGTTLVEVDRRSLVLERNTVAQCLPFLAAPQFA